MIVTGNEPDAAAAAAFPKRRQPKWRPGPAASFFIDRMSVSGSRAKFAAAYTEICFRLRGHCLYWAIVLAIETADDAAMLAMMFC